MKKTVLALSLMMGICASSAFAALPQSIRIGTDATYAPFSSKDAKGFRGF
jgi:lysine/arginine/ornithine transport system substrate-binding protein